MSVPFGLSTVQARSLSGLCSSGLCSQELGPLIYAGILDPPYISVLFSGLLWGFPLVKFLCPSQLWVICNWGRLRHGTSLTCCLSPCERSSAAQESQSLPVVCETFAYPHQLMLHVLSLLGSAHFGPELLLILRLMLLTGGTNYAARAPGPHSPGRQLGMNTLHGFFCMDMALDLEPRLDPAVNL